MDDLVSSSGKIVAAWRALESAEPQATRLFHDPLAAELAGGPALAEAERQAGAAPAGSGRRRRVSNVGARVWWFDQQLLAVLSGAHNSSGRDEALASEAGPAGAPPPPRQVVVLGAGFDCRPWRLDLPPEVAWFEVDVPAVVDAKRAALARLGAATAAGDGQEARHALRAASWAAIGADLASPGVAAALAGAGLDPARPTLWLAEGLLMYLRGDDCTALLAELAGASPPGSVLIAHNSTQAVLDLAASGRAGDYAPWPAALVATWLSGFPEATEAEALRSRLAATGWGRLGACTSRARIAAEIWGGGGGGSKKGGGGSGGGAGDGAGPSGAGDNCSAEGDGMGASGGGGDGAFDWLQGRCDFEVRPDRGSDRFAVFVVAGR